MGRNIKNLSLIILGLVLTISAQAARPVALILQTRDQNRVLFYAKDLKSLLKHTLPGHDVLIIETWNKDPEMNRQQMKQALRSFQTEGLITHLYFLAPTESTSSEISLYGIGSLSPVNGADKNFVDTLIPLQRKLADNAQIIFDACGKSCGSESFTQDLALRMGEFFEIPNGKVTAVLAPSSTSIPVSRGLLVQRKTILYTVLAGLATATVSTPLIVEGSSLSEFLNTWAAFASASTLFTLPIATLTDFLQRTVNSMRSTTIEVEFSPPAVEEVKSESLVKKSQVTSQNNFRLFRKIIRICKNIAKPNNTEAKGFFP